MVTSVQIFDLDGDGLPDVLYCDAQKNTVRWIRQAPRGAFTEQIIGEGIPAPAHVWAADINGTGRLDVLVASMGQITPNNDRIGSVVVLENLDNQHFKKRVLIDHVARVTDVRAADLMGHKNGLLDLVVGQFGYAQGETRWMENKGGWQFESHTVNTQSGCIHTPVADFDGDGKPDFAALISQEWEEVHWFRNNGNGQFQDTIAWGSTNEDYGSSGLAVADVNRDGKPDLIYTNGDGFDYALKSPRPWHGIQWLENVGFGNFRFHRVGDLPGAYAPVRRRFERRRVHRPAGGQRFCRLDQPAGGVDDGLVERRPRKFHARGPGAPTHPVRLGGSRRPRWQRRAGHRDRRLSRGAAVRPDEQHHPMAQKVKPPAEPTGGVPQVRGGKSRRWLIAGVILGLAGAGAIAVPFWRRHALVARLQAGLPPVPDRAGLPAVLVEKLRMAEIAARSSSSDALAGVAELGRLYHANGFTHEAEACWRLLRDAQPREPRWSYYLANLRRAASDYPEMETLLEQTVKQAPDYAPAWWQLGELKFKTGRLEAAQADYNRRLALLPQDPYARLGLARIALLQHRSDDAKQLLGQLLKDTPAFPPAHNLYVEILVAEGNTAEAAQHRLAGRETGRFRDPDDPWLKNLQDWCYDYAQLCNLGTIQYQAAPGDSYRSFFERAIKLRPDEPTAYEQLGIIYLQVNEPAKALEVLERGLARAKDSKPSILFYANLSRAYRALKRPADAVRIVRQGLAEAGDHFELYDALGVALGDLGEREAAVEALQAAVARSPGDANANYNLAIALLPLRRLDEAIEALHRSLTLQPTFPSALAMLAQIEIDSGRWRDAAQYLQPLYESHPEMPQARQLMAYWYLQAGMEAEAKKDLAAAEQHYRAGVAIAPNQPDLQSHLGTLCLIQGRFADAIGALEAYHRLQPNNARSALFLGQAYAATGRMDEAKRVLTEGVQVAERTGNATTAQHCREILQQLP